jgi:outer membrane murein-binding lipoprotein Lpp
MPHSDTPKMSYPADAAYNSREDLRRELVTLMKAENKVLDTRLLSVEGDAQEAKKIALSARKKAMEQHTCTELDTLAELKESVGAWAKWWRGIMITLIAAIVVVGTTAGGWWYSHTEVKAEVDTLGTRVGELNTKVDASQTSLDQFRTSFEVTEQKQKQAQEKQVKDIAEAVGKAVKKELRDSRRR